MTSEDTYAWILLSVPEEFGTLNDIIGMADAINHAIPTDSELKNSFGWLESKGLIQREGRRYALTESGKLFLREARKDSQTIMKTWRVVTERIRALGAQDEQRDA